MFKRFCLLVLMTALAAGTASAAQTRASSEATDSPPRHSSRSQSAYA